MTRTVALALVLLPSVAWAAPSKPSKPPPPTCYTAEEFKARYQQTAPLAEGVADNGIPWLIMVTPEGLLIMEVNQKTMKACIVRTLSPVQLYLPRSKPSGQDA
jgi:hypothetical protein